MRVDMEVTKGEGISGGEEGGRTGEMRGGRRTSLAGDRYRWVDPRKSVSAGWKRNRKAKRTDRTSEEDS